MGLWLSVSSGWLARGGGLGSGVTARPAGAEVRGRLEPPPHSEAFHVRFGFVLVLVLAVLPRVWAVWHTEVIQRDGVTFIRYARMLQTDLQGAIRQFDQHAGYPWLVSRVHAGLSPWLTEPDGVQGWEVSGQLVSLVSGVAATLGVWAWAGLALNWRVAWVAAGMFAVGRKWVMLGADVMSDATALALWVWAVVLAVWLARRLSAVGAGGRPAGVLAGAAVCGVLAGAAYLVRPEGLGALLVAWSAWGWSAARSGRGRLVRRAAWMGLASAVAAAAVAAPYALAIGGLTKKKPVGELLPVTWLAPSPAWAHPGLVGWPETGVALASVRGAELLLGMQGPAHDVATPLAVLAQTVEAMHPVVFGWMCVGVVLWVVHVSIPRSWRLRFLVLPQGGGAVAMAAAVVLYTIVAGRLHGTAGYLDWRHCMMLAFALVPLAGAGLMAIVDFLAVLASPLRLRSLTVRQFVGWQWAWAFPLVLVATGWQSFRPLHAQNNYVIAAAEKLRVELPKAGEGYVLTNLPWVLHYAQRPGRVVDTWRMSPEEALAAFEADRPRATHLVLSQRLLREESSRLFERLGPPGYELLEEIPQRQGQDWLRVYRIRGGDAGASSDGERLCPR